MRKVNLSIVLIIGLLMLGGCGVSNSVGEGELNSIELISDESTISIRYSNGVFSSFDGRITLQNNSEQVQEFYLDYYLPSELSVMLGAEKCTGYMEGTKEPKRITLPGKSKATVQVSFVGNKFNPTVKKNPFDKSTSVSIMGTENVATVAVYNDDEYVMIGQEISK